MYVSQAAPKDLNMPFPMGPFKQGKDEAVSNHHHAQQQQQQRMPSGLFRYGSAPSTMLGEMREEMLPHRSSSPETESLLARFMSPEIREHMEKPSSTGGTATATEQRNSQYMNPIGHEAMEAFHQPGGRFPSSASHLYHTQPQPQIHRQDSAAAAAVAVSSYRVGTSMAMDDKQGKSGMSSSNLIRHSSSPPGLLSQLGFESMSSMSGLKGQISFSAKPSSSALMPQISEMGRESLGGNNPDDEALRQNNGASRSYIPGFPVTSWEDPSFLSHGLAGLKRPRDSTEPQSGDVRTAFPSLSPHFSLPKTSSEMAGILQFQDTVPCKIRAKRGCATHPRSIAERVRRTRISERMRKLQELVPNMDKQTNTADMLDLAVDYIKDLQTKVKSLSESRASCCCFSKQKS